MRSKGCGQRIGAFHMTAAPHVLLFATRAFQKHAAGMCASACGEPECMLWVSAPLLKQFIYCSLLQTSHNLVSCKWDPMPYMCVCAQGSYAWLLSRARARLFAFSTRGLVQQAEMHAIGAGANASLQKAPTGSAATSGMCKWVNSTQWRLRILLMLTRAVWFVWHAYLEAAARGFAPPTLLPAPVQQAVTTS